ncbi:MAG TPA: nicotinate phosphoribosyltransferase [Anaeromyxobacter sp.]|nr:nicotinate phosphoribosyltransferase [Anaeromyxobacter sp.]
MRKLSELYRPSLALLTDLYQLTMACAAWRAGLADREAVFHLLFRKNPFGGGYSIACGLEYALDYLASLRFDEEDLAYLAGVTGADGGRLFPDDFLAALRELPLALDVDAVPEGTVVFPNEPLLRVRGPIIPAMLVETPLLNIVNFQTLIATKASRIVHAAQGEPVIDFGLRRAQGIDGALTASRAAYAGGCAATSNVLAGRLFGIPVKGTHAHSWVMLFDTEREAFETYAKALPNNCVFLVDTYDTLEGVRNAIEVGRWLRDHGHQLLGIRLDSGDLAWFSVEARKLLDAAGFPDAKILASNDLDEQTIESLKGQGATIAVWGVGTRLVTGHDHPALGGVYKLGAVRRPGEPWKYRVKLSEQAAKTTTPGVLQVRRFETAAGLVADGIFDESRGWPDGPRAIVDPLDFTRQKRIPAEARQTDLLVPVLRAGRPVYEAPPLAAIRDRALAEVARLPASLKRFLNPHQYPVGLEPSLHELKTRLVLEARGAVRR